VNCQLSRLIVRVLAKDTWGLREPEGVIDDLVFCFLTAWGMKGVRQGVKADLYLGRSRRGFIFGRPTVHSGSDQ
jgi:hypothetical protein